MAEDPVELSLVSDRSCDGCTMCCKVLTIVEIEKPAQVWCSDCAIGTGCKIYEDRPKPCREFFCHYRRDAGLGEHWAPKKSKIIVAYEDENERLAIHVDESRKTAWRQAPFYQEIMNWVRRLTREGKHVMVWEGKNAIVVLPDKEINLGPIGANQEMIVEKLNTPTGPVIVNARVP